MPWSLGDFDFLISGGGKNGYFLRYLLSPNYLHKELHNRYLDRQDLEYVVVQCSK